MQVNIKHRINDVPCDQTVRELRWPDGVVCPSCEAQPVIKRGFNDTAPARQRYACHTCDPRFDALTDTLFAGHHHPRKVWSLCRYCMGLNGSNAQIVHELSLHESAAYPMTPALRGGMGTPSPQGRFPRRWSATKPLCLLAIRDSQRSCSPRGAQVVDANAAATGDAARWRRKDHRSLG